MTEKLSTLFEAEERARQLTEEAAKDARRIRAGIASGVNELEKNYAQALVAFEEKEMRKINKKLDALSQEQQSLLEKGKRELDSKLHVLEERALELIHSAVEGEGKGK